MENGAIDYSTRKESDPQSRREPQQVRNKPQPSPWGSLAEVRGGFNKISLAPRPTMRLETNQVTQKRVLNVPHFESWLIKKTRQNRSTYYPHIDRLVQIAVASKRMKEKNVAFA